MQFTEKVTKITRIIKAVKSRNVGLNVKCKNVGLNVKVEMDDTILTHYDLNLSDTELRFLFLVCTSSHSHNIYN